LCLAIAATARLHRNNDSTLKVPSQTSKEAIFYTDNLETKACTCLDCTDGGFVCKHFHAASIVYKRDVLPKGTMIETQSMTLTKRTVYKQDWPAYNLAQTTEKKLLQVLLHDLCPNLSDWDRTKSKGGPKPHLVRDAIFSMAYKVYCGLSSRRFSCDLIEAHEQGMRQCRKLRDGCRVRRTGIHRFQVEQQRARGSMMVRALELVPGD
jgi:hypothetical protein